MMSIIDRESAMRGARSVLRYRADHDNGASVTEAMTDLLADLMHFADGIGIDFTDVLHGAERHHTAEVIEYLRAKLGFTEEVSA